MPSCVCSADNVCSYVVCFTTKVFENAKITVFHYDALGHVNIRACIKKKKKCFPYHSENSLLTICPAVDDGSVD